MQIRVKSLQGAEYVVQVKNDQLVSQLKTDISEKSEGRLPVGRQKLVYKGRALQDSSLLSDYNLERDCTIHLFLQKDNTNQSPTSGTAGQSSVSNQLDSSNFGGNDKNELSREKLNRPPSRFETLLRERLGKESLFTQDEIDRILRAINKEISAGISSSSLDDLERLAKQKLNISNE